MSTRLFKRSIGLLTPLIPLLIAGSVGALSQIWVVIPNVAKVKAIGIGVYQDAGCVTRLTEINWGFLEPAETKSFTLYLRSESNVPITLNMTTQNWNPSEAKDFITLTWDREGENLQVKQVVEATITLTVSPNISGVTNFSFDIILTGVG